MVLGSATDKSIVNDGNLIMLDIKKTAKSEKGGLQIGFFYRLIGLWSNQST